MQKAVKRLLKRDFIFSTFGSFLFIIGVRSPQPFNFGWESSQSGIQTFFTALKRNLRQKRPSIALGGLFF
jgi:hypothetical protein